MATNEFNYLSEVLKSNRQVHNQIKESLQSMNFDQPEDFRRVANTYLSYFELNNVVFDALIKSVEFLFEQVSAIPVAKPENIALKIMELQTEINDNTETLKMVKEKLGMQ